MTTHAETLAEWPDTTAPNLYALQQSREFVEIHNSPRPDCVALYLSDGKVRWPARDVFLGNVKHATSVLNSWAKRGIKDCRRDKTETLPITIPENRP